MGGVMSSVTISGDTSGSIILQAPSVAGSTTLTLPTTSGTVLTNASSVASSQLPAGSVLQVVQTVKTDTYSTNSTTFQDVPGLSVSITPLSSTSRVLIFANVYTGTASVGQGVQTQVRRGNTNLIASSSPGNRTPSIGQQEAGGLSFAQYWGMQATWIFQDSPATTSLTTYKIVIRTNTGAGNVYVNRNDYSIDQAESGIGTSQLIVMEIKG